MYSLNEVETTAKRAAWGAGVPWGLAEDAGKAVRWLAAQGLSGPKALAQLLTGFDDKPYQLFSPQSDAGVWTASAGALCPLVSGAAVSDMAATLAAGRTIDFGPCFVPILLLPFAAMAASLTDGPVSVAWDGAAFTATPDALFLDASPDTLSAQSTRAVTWSAELQANRVFQPQARLRIATEDWTALLAFGHRTFAPDTEASRLAGAGAGETDND
ncbi:DUF3726 domain-containing protein [Ascidiaceihabitans sp.]|uniref:DUF3726 domain-containing protein n=1 Tax=Ascidiaceihabitans sp. TaxID=1872644 RepID=UPI003296EE9A